MSEVKFEFSNDAISFISGLEAKQVKQIWARVIALKRDPRPAYSEHLSGYPATESERCWAGVIAAY